jgi:hypothetical protein
MATPKSSVARMDRNAMPADTREHHVTLSIRVAPYLWCGGEDRGRAVRGTHRVDVGTGGFVLLRHTRLDTAGKRARLGCTPDSRE